MKHTHPLPNLQPGNPSLHRTPFALLALVVLLIGANARADSVIFDLSPAAVNGGISNDVSNQYGLQWFYEPVSFSLGATVTGIAIYSDPADLSVGSPVVIDVRSDPSQANPVYNEYTTISEVDTDGVLPGESAVEAYAPFSTPLTMQPGQTLWFSLSGQPYNPIGQGLFDPSYAFPPNNYYQASFSYNGGSSGDVAMRLYGTDPNTIPEPSSLALCAAAAGGLLIRHRRGT